MRRSFAILLTLALMSCLIAVPTFANEGSYVLQAGQWECKSKVMTGAYTDLSDWPSDLGAVSLSFVSNGNSFSSVSYEYSFHTSGFYLYYGDIMVYSYGTIDHGWTDDAYAKIYFETDQQVTQAFYDWFTGNFTYSGNGQEETTFRTVVNIYDTTGETLLESYAVYGTGSAPIFNGSVLDNGLQLTDVSGFSRIWTCDDDSFIGFSGAPGTTIVYGIGATFIAGGQAADHTVNLYVAGFVLEDPDDTEYKNNVFGWFQRILDAIKNLPNLLVEGIKNLFLPSQEAVFDFRNKMESLLRDRLGPAYEASEVIEDFAYSFANSPATLDENFEPATLDFPAFTVNLAGADFTIGGWEVQIIPDGFEDIVAILNTVVNMVCTLAFVNALRGRLEGVFH